MSNLKLKVVQLPLTGKGEVIVKRYKKAHAASPIKDASTLKAMRAALADSGKYSRRNLAIFDLGVCSGRRCGDILCLQLHEVWSDLHGLKNKIEYWDQKTRKWKRFFLSDIAYNNLKQYVEEAGYVVDGKRVVPVNTYLFPSRKKSEKVQPGTFTVTKTKIVDGIVQEVTAEYKHRSLPSGCLEVSTYRRILTDAARKHAITGIEHLGTHTMRKTFGYHGFRQNGAEFVQLALGHSSMNVTQHYLTLDDEYLEKEYTRLKIPGMEEEV